MKRFLAILILLTAQTPAHACSVCFYGDPNQAAAIGLRWAIITLLVFLVIIMIAFVKFLYSFNKRAGRNQ